MANPGASAAESARPSALLSVAAEGLRALRSQLLEQLLDAASALVSVEDADRRIVLANAAYLRAVGGSEQDVIGNGCRLFTAYAAAGAARANEAVSVENVQHAAEGPRIYLVSRSPIRDVDRNIVGAIAIALDVSGIALAAPDPQHDGDRGASRARDEFITIAAHELRSPLNALRGWSHLLMHAPAPSADLIGRASAAIDRNVECQARLIDELTHVWRRLGALSDGRRAALDMNAELRAAIAQLHARSDSEVTAVAGVASVRIVESRCALVMASAEQLREALLHLLSAAVALAPPDGVVEAGARDMGARVQTYIKVASASSDARPRSGIGYALARHLIEMHGGTLRAEREENGVSSFVFDLPSAQAAADGAAGPAI